MYLLCMYTICQLLTPAIIEGGQLLSAVRTVITDLPVFSDTAVTEHLSTVTMLLGVSGNR